VHGIYHHDVVLSYNFADRRTTRPSSSVTGRPPPDGRGLIKIDEAAGHQWSQPC
jgi:hypothetical protein